MRSKLIGLLAATVLTVALGGPALAIVYGEPDTENQYSNVGALIAQFDDGKYVICTGTLISPTVFLTAAHCVDDGGTYWVSFDPFIDEPVTGKTKTYEGTAYAHPDFASGGMNDTFDIAVVVLDRAVRGIEPAQLPTLNLLDEMSAQELKSATFVAVGYGTVRETRKGSFQPLVWDPHRRFAEQTVNSLEPAWLSLSMNQATGDGGTCYGDSGGPHFLGDVVVSITVIGDAFCKATDKTYRLDTQVARDFLDDFVVLP
jgi:hypothetical protein